VAGLHFVAFACLMLHRFALSASTSPCDAHVTTCQRRARTS
jgi:hypothetical protein